MVFNRFTNLNVRRSRGVIQDRGKPNCNFVYEIGRATKSKYCGRHLKSKMSKLSQETWTKEHMQLQRKHQDQRHFDLLGDPESDDKTENRAFPQTMPSYQIPHSAHPHRLALSTCEPTHRPPEERVRTLFSPFRRNQEREGQVLRENSLK